MSTSMGKDASGRRKKRARRLQFLPTANACRLYSYFFLIVEIFNGT